MYSACVHPIYSGHRLYGRVTKKHFIFIRIQSYLRIAHKINETICFILISIAQKHSLCVCSKIKNKKKLLFFITAVVTLLIVCAYQQSNLDLIFGKMPSPTTRPYSGFVVSSCCRSISFHHCFRSCIAFQRGSQNKIDMND